MNSIFNIPYTLFENHTFYLPSSLGIIQAKLLNRKVD